MATARYRRVQGFIATRNLLKRLPDAVKNELASEMDTVGDEMLSAMEAAVPRKTGALASGLSKRFLRASLRLRVGLVGKPINRRLFYGRILEFGRKAQTVTVSRNAAHLAAGGPRIGRRLRALNAGTTGVYQLRVKPLAPRHFAYTPMTKQLKDWLANRANAIWSRALTAAASGVSDA